MDEIPFALDAAKDVGDADGHRGGALASTDTAFKRDDVGTNMTPVARVARADG